MKELIVGFILGILTTLIIGIIAYFIFKPKIDMPDNSARESELSSKIEQLVSQNVILQRERDSLLTIPPKIDRQIVYRDREIDSNIAKDSSNALVEFRKSLQDNDIIPDGTETPTYRELGWSAKIMSAKPKLELKVKTYEEIVFKDDIIISDLKYQINGWEELNEMQKESTKYYKALYEDEASWLNSNYLWLGIGAVGAGLAVFLAGGLK